ncbi:MULTISPECIES: peptide deformylase [Trueperella]|uniref:Peptide deformylase n=1 Tax=Trueperella abortisuis TaxID=445930 RepID=A0ABT9PH03_9ACTO|nr:MULTISPECIES: peptide deformylase [Trueperella]MCI7304901.1 peptide deformylase [Trueperella sp.]MDP9831767.1 peptide deformylase [Trueperella abortisuis]MDY5404590.1 peptide deformylase [Trueperella sp.]
MIYPIHVYGSPVLHKVSEPVTQFDADLAQLVEDMYETTVAAPGVGLAAPQIGLDKAMFVWVFDEHDGPERGVAINPTLLIEPIDTIEPDKHADSEGCLSFPGYSFPIRRSPYALLRAQNEKGEWYELEARGWFARILQHEYDHLKGRIYVDRLQGKLAKRVTQVMKAEKWNVPGIKWMPGPGSPYEPEE